MHSETAMADPAMIPSGLSAGCWANYKTVKLDRIASDISGIILQGWIRLSEKVTRMSLFENLTNAERDFTQWRNIIRIENQEAVFLKTLCSLNDSKICRTPTNIIIFVIIIIGFEKCL